jgi:hypothetical protein
LGAAFFTKKAASFRSFLKKAAPKTSVILKRTFQTASERFVVFRQAIDAFDTGRTVVIDIRRDK